MGWSFRCFMSRVKNSRLGPPVSIPSSRTPVSSVNLTSMSQVSEYVVRLKPLTAPSQTLALEMLNLRTLLWSIVSDRFATMSGNVMSISVMRKSDLICGYSRYIRTIVQWKNRSASQKLSYYIAVCWKFFTLTATGSSSSCSTFGEYRSVYFLLGNYHFHVKTSYKQKCSSHVIS